MARLPDIAAAVLAAAQVNPIWSRPTDNLPAIADAVWSKTLP